MLRRLPLARKLLVIVCVFVAIVICVFYLGLLRSEILSGVRAYVGGESHWSKAQKRAALSLTKYSSTHAESDYQQYLIEIAVPVGDQQARLELQRPSPDMALVARSFVQGRNDPEDVESMGDLFRRFGHVGYMARAIAVWTEGDRYIDELRSVANQLHEEVNAAQADAQKVQYLADRVAAIDASLTPLEDEFSSTLSAGARWMNRVLSVVTIAVSGFLLLIGVAFSTAVLKQIKNSEEKYRNLIDTANDAIFVIDAESRLILDANQRACNLLGASERELVGMPEDRLYPSKENGVIPRMSQQWVASQGREFELLRSDGTAIPVEVSASATELDGKPAVLGIFRDVRYRLEAAAILRRSEERFSDLIQNLSDIITVVGVDGTMLYHTPSIERVSGYSPSELMGKNLLELVHPDDEESVRSSLEAVMLKQRSSASQEFRLRHRNGSWVWLESGINNLLTDSAVGGIVITSRDVSDRRLLEEQVRQSQKMEAVGRLAGGIAHDFNNLLMVVRGYGEILLDQVGENSPARASIETIIRATGSAAKLTRQLLSLSRKHTFTPQVLDLNVHVTQMNEMIRGLLGEDREFILKLDPVAGSVSADPGQIEQVIMNLVVNARDAMPHGGKLVIQSSHVLPEAMGDHRPPGLPRGNYVMLAISDSGIGMDAETQSRIFEPFFTTKSMDAGTGLGLSVVYNIVRGSGGQVTVSSEVGKGSTFRIFLPRVAAIGTRQAIAEPVNRGAGGGNETVLVAEDQPDLRWMICQFLQDLGYSVLEAKDGNDALALAEQYRGAIDVLLTDVVMPEIRGPELARRLLALRPNLKIIFMSGYTEGALDIQPGEQPPEAALLQKPFDLNFMAGRIREVLGTRSRT